MQPQQTPCFSVPNVHVYVTACHESIRSALRASLSAHDRSSYREGTRQSLSDVEVEDIDDEPFEFDSRTYLF